MQNRSDESSTYKNVLYMIVTLSIFPPYLQLSWVLQFSVHLQPVVFIFRLFGLCCFCSKYSIPYVLNYRYWVSSYWKMSRSARFCWMICNLVSWCLIIIAELFWICVLSRQFILKQIHYLMCIYLKWYKNIENQTSWWKMISHI